MRSGAIVGCSNLGQAARREHWRHLIRVARRESREFGLVGAVHAAKYWAKRAARLQYRLDQLGE